MFHHSVCLLILSVIYTLITISRFKDRSDWPEMSRDHLGMPPEYVFIIHTALIALIGVLSAAIIFLHIRITRTQSESQRTESDRDNDDDEEGEKGPPADDEVQYQCYSTLANILYFLAVIGCFAVVIGFYYLYTYMTVQSFLPLSYLLIPLVWLCSFCCLTSPRVEREDTE